MIVGLAQVSIPYGKGKAFGTNSKILHHLRVSIPYGKGKVDIGHLRKLLTAKVSIPYGKGKAKEAGVEIK